jgi:hypothetical protein
MARGGVGGLLVSGAGAKGLRPVAWLGRCRWVGWSYSLRVKTGWNFRYISIGFPKAGLFVRSFPAGGVAKKLFFLILSRFGTH